MKHRILDLRAARKRQGWTLREVAEMVWSKAPTLSQVENGLREPSPVLAQRLAALYGVSRITVYRWYLRTVLKVRKPKLIGRRSLG